MKFLRVLQDGEFKRIGSTRAIKVDVRVIAATNKDLIQAISEKSFREDLFYRLNVIPIHLPPLRERKEDIPLSDQSLPDGLQQRARQSRGRILAGGHPEDDDVSVAGQHPRAEEQGQASDGADPQQRHHRRGPLLPRPRLLEQVPVVQGSQSASSRKEYISQVLRICQGNISQAARLAKKDRKDFYDVMKKYGIQPEAFRKQQAG